MRIDWDAPRDLQQSRRQWEWRNYANARTNARSAALGHQKSRPKRRTTGVGRRTLGSVFPLLRKRTETPKCYMSRTKRTFIGRYAVRRHQADDEARLSAPRVPLSEGSRSAASGHICDPRSDYRACFTRRTPVKRISAEPQRTQPCTAQQTSTGRFAGVSRTSPYCQKQSIFFLAPRQRRRDGDAGPAEHSLSSAENDGSEFAKPL